MTAVQVLTTGGTIASTSDSGGVRPAVPGTALVAPVAGALGSRVAVREISRGLSFNHSLTDTLRIVRAVVADAARHDGHGIVVTHGTDTMQETAYLTDLVLGDGHTVVFTGAQRHAGEADGDGPRNLADAIRIASEPRTRGLGAVVAMAGRIHPARDVVKVHTRAVDAFDSPTPIGTVFDGRVQIHTRPLRPARFTLAELRGLDHRVDIVPVYPGADGTQLAACRAAGARGIVLQALGAGNPTPGILAEVRRCLAAGLVILVCSRCPHGPTTPIYGDGGGADLAAAGAIFAGALPAPQARLLLAAALSAAPDARRATARIAPHLG